MFPLSFPHDNDKKRKESKETLGKSKPSNHRPSCNLLLSLFIILSFSFFLSKKYTMERFNCRCQTHIYRMETRVNYLIFPFLSQTPNPPLLTAPPPQTYLFYPKHKAFFTKSFIMLAGGLGVFSNTYGLIGNGGVVTCQECFLTHTV